jgi:hypothetical protein
MSLALMASRLLTDAPGGEFPVMPVHEAPPRRAGADLTGDYHWRKDAGLRNRKLRPLRVSKPGLIP